MSLILVLLQFVAVVSVIVILIAFFKRNRQPTPHARTYGILLLVPLLLSVLFNVMLHTCVGDAGAGFSCFGSADLGNVFFGFGWIFGLLIYPLTMVTTPIGIYFLARALLHSSQAPSSKEIPTEVPTNTGANK